MACDPLGSDREKCAHKITLSRWAFEGETRTESQCRAREILRRKAIEQVKRRAGEGVSSDSRIGWLQVMLNRISKKFRFGHSQGMKNVKIFEEYTAFVCFSMSG
jgi:hypothetical protein